MKDITYEITVTDSGNANVTHEGIDFATSKFKQNKDKARFHSNRADTVIRYNKTTPFDQNELPADTVFQVGKATKGPFKTINIGDHHFDCGRMLNGQFSKWALTKGDDTPVES